MGSFESFDQFRQQQHQALPVGIIIDHDRGIDVTGKPRLAAPTPQTRRPAPSGGRTSQDQL
jgi:hypothetical protein